MSCVKGFVKPNTFKKFSLIWFRAFSNGNATTLNLSQDDDKEVKSVKQLLENTLVSSFEEKPVVDPEDRSVLLFPGQGSQFVGMVDHLLEYPNVSDMFNVASDTLNFDLLRYCQVGPKQELDKTVHCQPAILVASLAGVEKIQVRFSLFVTPSINITSFFSI